MKFKKKEDQSVGASISLIKGIKYSQAVMETKCGVETEGKATQRTVLPGDSSYQQSPNPDTIIDDKICLPKGACYGCLLQEPYKYRGRC